jgi:UDP-N-acetyl-D-mannosaminuronic acid dehydrogenase
MNTEKTCIVGLGYIGLPTAAIVALSKKYVIGVDVNESVVKTVNNGDIHIVEPGLLNAVDKAVSGGYLKAVVTPEPAEVFLIAVPTPFKDNDHKPDLSYIKAAAASISTVLKPGDLVILESTSPVGTTEMLRDWLASSRPDLVFPSKESDTPNIFIAYCPERVLPGNVIQELLENDRIIGGLCDESADNAACFYESFINGQCLKTNARTAEMAKLVENSYRDVNIAFANELALISKGLDINVWELIKLANRHPRVNILKPGAGVGGHCIAVDPWFIVDKSPDESLLIKQARLVNDQTPILIFENIVDVCLDRQIQKPDKIKIGVFGLAYKPDSDDLRESPSLQITMMLSKRFPGQIYAVEPYINEMNEAINGAFTLISQNEALHFCDLIVILVPHTEFKKTFEVNKTEIDILDYCGLTEI